MITVAAIALGLAALVFVLFVRERDIPAPVAVSPTQHLDDRKQAIYDNLRDLQFEYRVGKLSDDDYQSTKQALQKELAAVLSETEAILTSLGGPVRASAKAFSPVKAEKPARPAGTECPSCGATFPQTLKYCGQCGKAIA